MEPLTPALIAVTTLILKKAFEKTGEKLGEAVSVQLSQFVQLIQRKSLLKTAQIEQADQPVDMGQAVLEVETVSATDPELAQAVTQLAESVKADPRLSQLMPAYAEALQTARPTTIKNYGKLAEEIKNLFQGNTFNAPVTFN
ncbi:MAG: hypothetical protein KME45_19965 [Stenomitos rutilans HA7619-LM2]|jgi:vacuolar-type H+-ATPase subunit I/STV1|nr:hypothetical protein [Stenomitos rutilans HA7619-LM2]